MECLQGGSEPDERILIWGIDAEPNGGRTGSNSASRRAGDPEFCSRSRNDAPMLVATRMASSSWTGTCTKQRGNLSYGCGSTDLVHHRYPARLSSQPGCRSVVVQDT